MTDDPKRQGDTSDETEEVADTDDLPETTPDGDASEGEGGEPE